MQDRVREGARNLVLNCAEVQRGDSVLIVNEVGKTDPVLADLIREEVKAAGAEYYVIWAEPLPGSRARVAGATPDRRAWADGRESAELPRVIASAMGCVNKVIASWAAQGATIAEYLTDRGPLWVNHALICSPDVMGSEYGTYHWGMQNAIYQRFDELASRVGTEWRITTPAGTELRGRIGPESERRAHLEEMGCDFIRPFTLNAYKPVGTQGARGRIVNEFVGGGQRVPCDQTPTIVVEDDRIVRIEGDRNPDALRQYRQALVDRLERNGASAEQVDSWHGGLHPTAVTRPGVVGNASTETMHFHLGRNRDHFASEISQPTIELGGRFVVKDGRLALLDDPKLVEAARRFRVHL